MTGYEVPLAQTSIKGMNASIDPLVIAQGIQLEGIVGLVACVAALLVAVWVIRMKYIENCEIVINTLILLMCMLLGCELAMYIRGW